MGKYIKSMIENIYPPVQHKLIEQKRITLWQ